MKQRGVRYVFWWIIPCKAISGVFRELAAMEGCRVTVVAAGDLTDARRQLGWESPDFGSADLRVLPQRDWRREVGAILRETPDAVHVFNGGSAYRRILFAHRSAARMGLRTAVMTESYNNAFTGVRALAKEIYVRIVPRIRMGPLARRNLFVLCLSGASVRAHVWLRTFGWRDEQVFPFGYFSEEPSTEPPSLRAAASRGPVRLLCTGYLTRNKGQHLLLHALARLRAEGADFHCDITGYGPAKSQLECLNRALGLESRVQFRGVLPTDELHRLMAGADIFVAPGLREPWGIRINEALQAGLAVVTSDGIGACELVRASLGGAVFPSGSADALRKAIGLLVSDPQMLAQCREHTWHYRPRIHPRTAACYVNAVLQYALGPKRERPAPPWL